MVRRRRRISVWALAVLGLFASLAAGGAAAAQVIENVAFARWTEAGTAMEAASNRVTVQTSTAPLTITTFRAAPGGATSITYTPSPCSGGPAAAGPITVGIAPAREFRMGEAILFEIIAAFANRDPGAVDTVTLAITAAGGDREALTVFETGPDTGRFFGSVATGRAGSAPATGDCRLNVGPGETVTLTPAGAMADAAVLQRVVTVLADPFGIVFDSETGAPVSGARVSLRDAVSGAPAQVFAEDGVTPWPSSVISGEPITDGAGRVWPMQPGRYWFPLTNLGRYRIAVEPPSPYTAPSSATPAALARLTRPDGVAFVIAPASFGAAFDLDSPLPVEIDIPVDRNDAAVTLSMAVSRPLAQPGDALVYTITARNPLAQQERRGITLASALPRGLRLRPDTVRIDGIARPDAVQVAPDGLSLTIRLDTIPAGGAVRIAYAASVRADAPPGQLESTAQATDAVGRRARASAAVRVERDSVASRMTIIGRVVLGGCSADEDGSGVAGVRLMLEDGSFAVTDADGRYRFEGVVPGTHVVQAARSTLPDGSDFADCAASTRSAGSAASRFVIGQGGSLVRADFHVVTTAAAAAAAASAPRIETALLSTPAPTLPPAPAETDWLALGDGPDGWLTPAEDHNPRVPAIKVAFRHRPGQTVRLLVDGQPVDPAALDGARQSPGGRFAVSAWRGIPLRGYKTVLTAEVVDAKGKITARQERAVFFSAEPARAELITEQSLLIADGFTRPVLTVRITDRNGRPVHAGVSGEFVLSAPFESASQIDLAQLQQLSGVGEASARWVIEGDEGLARIELAPTMVSGRLRIDFSFAAENIRRRQEIEAWVVPGDIPWTLIGLGEATLGARSVADNMERGADFDSDLGRNARVALYAKGRVLGKYLLTLAYDSAKQRDDQPLLGAIDPTAYYTVFGDNAQRRFDAASRENLYVRIETAAFQALYGDFQTGFDDTALGRYQRTATGIRAEAQVGQLRAEAFGARIGSTFRRDEFQGNGLAGPYPLGSRDIVINSERVTIEVRDRFRSEVVVSSRSLARFIDYSIDALSGTITFSQPILSRDGDLNPQIVIIEYETAGTGGGAINAGVRADWTSADARLRIGATAITDKGDGPRTTLGVADARLRLGTATEVRSEIAMSAQDGAAASAWLVEVQHQTGKLDVVAYARMIEDGYGIGQQSVAEAGRRKLGMDARYQISDHLSAIATALADDSLADARRRRGGQGQLVWRSPTTDARLGLAHFGDRLADGSSASSTVLETGLTQRLLGNQLELSAASSFALGTAGSLDLPARHQFGLRYAIARDVRVTGTYEIAEGPQIDARSLRAGIEVTPWEGGRIVTSLGQNSAPGSTFAAFGAAQTVALSPTLNLSATLDGNRILGPAPGEQAVINPAQPVTNGGPLSVDQTLFEDFTAVTLTGTWRKDRWSATGRGEYRAGQFAKRGGVTFGVIRQLGEGSAVGGNLAWTRSTAPGGAATEVTDALFSIAHRPDGGDIALLSRIAYRSDSVSGAVAGERGPDGRTALTVTGDAVSRRLIGSLAANWAPRTRGRPGQLSEIGLFLGTRYSFDRLEGLDLRGLTALAGLDLRLGLGERIDIGGSASLRANLTDGSASYAIGPQASVVVAEGTLLSLGYNIAGFRDPDFSFDRAVEQGLFAAIRLKFGADLFGTQRSPSAAIPPRAPAP